VHLKTRSNFIQIFQPAHISANADTFITHGWINLDKLREFVARTNDNQNSVLLSTRVKLEEDPSATRILAAMPFISPAGSSGIKTRLLKEGGRDVFESLRFCLKLSFVEAIQWY
jgi:hypothetical protein